MAFLFSPLPPLSSGEDRKRGEIYFEAKKERGTFSSLKLLVSLSFPFVAFIYTKCMSVRKLCKHI